MSNEILDSLLKEYDRKKMKAENESRKWSVEYKYDGIYDISNKCFQRVRRI